MVRIKKTWEPKELTKFIKNGAVTYKDLDSAKGVLVKRKIQEVLCSEQFGLCAYCMCRISLETMRIEHFIPQSHNPQMGLDYKNMLAVCDGGEKYNKDNGLKDKSNLSCDVYKGAALLSLNPSVKADYEQMKIRYSSDGKIHSDSFNNNFKKEIEEVLNLNVPRLKNMRKAAKKTVIKFIKDKGGLTSSQKEDRIKALKTPKNGLLPPFFDVSVYFMKKLCN